MFSRAIWFVGFLVTMSLTVLGQECDIIYVAPNGSGSGTKAGPTSIQNALDLVSSTGVNQIRMAQGTYPISDTLFLVSGVTIDGGYDPSTWVKSNNVPTIIHRDALNPPPPIPPPSSVAVLFSIVEFVTTAVKP